jgi:prepilin-type N-terminal cleavage/methylation domain-containing protein
MVPGRLQRLNSAGFGMAELLVVVAVIGVLVALGTPYAMTYLQGAKVRAGAQELATVMSGARQLAIARNTNVCVTLQGTAATYRTNVSAACAGGTLFVGTMTQGDGTIPLSNDMAITGTTANVVFSPLGAALVAGTYTVHNPQGANDRQVVVSASGRIRIN